MICPKGIVQSNILSLNYSTFRIFKTTLHDFITLESHVNNYFSIVNLSLGSPKFKKSVRFLVLNGQTILHFFY